MIVVELVELIVVGPKAVNVIEFENEEYLLADYDDHNTFVHDDTEAG